MSMRTESVGTEAVVDETLHPAHAAAVALFQPARASVWIRGEGR